mmetsp:Transcript_44615/g.111066  ORF Transcript_44615/g.111066 Transcript_44615/m.111066 type:complete len:252 (+) Transcript_44615:948-1703(+)
MVEVLVLEREEVLVATDDGEELEGVRVVAARVRGVAADRGGGELRQLLVEQCVLRRGVLEAGLEIFELFGPRLILTLQTDAQLLQLRHELRLFVLRRVACCLSVLLRLLRLRQLLHVVRVIGQLAAVPRLRTFLRLLRRAQLHLHRLHRRRVRGRRRLLGGLCLLRARACLVRRLLRGGQLTAHPAHSLAYCLLRGFRLLALLERLVPRSLGLLDSRVVHGLHLRRQLQLLVALRLRCLRQLAVLLRMLFL